jgi:GNAT superfamily N-acetyltransferase
MSLPTNSQFAGLWGGATLPQYRKMGIYTAVVAARAQEAIRRGYRFLTVDAGDMSRPILQKRGFQLLTYTTPYTWKPPQSD